MEAVTQVEIVTFFFERCIYMTFFRGKRVKKIRCFNILFYYIFI